MSVNKYLEAFAKPFDVSKVKWRLQGTNKEKNGGYAVPYLDSRTIAQRLDDVVGQMRWKDEYRPWINTKESASQLCVIYIYDDDLKEWIGKSDGASLSNIEPVKGGISDAFKRAAVKWGIGRYLYDMNPIWVEAEQRGNSTIIKSSEYKKLNDSYIVFLRRITSQAPVQKSAPQTTGNVQPIQKPAYTQPAQPKAVAAYEVMGVKEQRGASGVNSLLRIKHNGNGKVITAYFNGTDSNLITGAKLGRAVFTSKKTAYGDVNILQDFDLAA